MSLLLLVLLASCHQEPLQISGIYPHLAHYNEEGECGTGAVVPWADHLWVVTYGPHFPYGSSDKLYEISYDLERVERQESIGGTPANRMIHRESQQLFIGPYAISADRHVRVIPYDQMPGRHTGNARHLTDPEEMIYYATMEEGFYEVDVNTLGVRILYPDAHELPEKEYGSLLPGAHGKGLYSGQGVLVYANNGERSPEALERFDIESGALAEWNGVDWKLVRRNQFVEVTGPGGIHGNEDPQNDPIWTTGWDHKSLLLGVRDAGSGLWDFYRLPKASHSYDGAHGWNTEWPRIRDVELLGNRDFLMTMHGMFWRFPGKFSRGNSSGVRPRSAYLKVIGDFTRWRGQLVFGCDDSAHREFLNKRKVKGNISGPGQSNSNLWFTDLDMPDHLGPTTAEGGVWLREQMDAGIPSEPFLFAGWSERCCWIHNESDSIVNFVFEVDRRGNGHWKELKRINVRGNGSALIDFSEDERAEWVRVIPHKSASGTVHFSYTEDEKRASVTDGIFQGLAEVKDAEGIGGLLYGLGGNRRTLGVAVHHYRDTDQTVTGYYELNEKLELVPVENPDTLQFILDRFAMPREVITVDKSSVLVIDDQGRRWRLPMGDNAFTKPTMAAAMRICREVATERDLFNCHGTFYELPAENADGFAKIRPIASHPFRIHDYASYRGLLVMTGIQPDAAGNKSHLILSDDGRAAVWAGVIDDLWKLGKPTGYGGPWLKTEIDSGQVSDPFLIGFYDDRRLIISHESKRPVTFDIETDPVGNGPWMLYQRVTIGAGKEYRHRFPDYFQSRWIRFRSDSPTRATAWLVYE
ncbi:MAG: hypothetical protein AMS26_24270 [Bacteroides sp. SM23_62]|nr:MAG: hypothetical protein AMS26_24270 [Bacteroides sp. SM23_62]